MNEPIIFTVGDIVAIIKAITWLIGSVGIISGAIIWLWSKLRKPNQTQNERLDALEAWKKQVDNRLTEGNDHFSKIDESNRVTQTALLALLSHGIDGNSIDPMKEAKKELEGYLVNK